MLRDARCASQRLVLIWHVRVRRGAETLTLQGQLRFAAGDVRIEALPDASAKAARIRAGILTGK